MTSLRFTPCRRLFAVVSLIALVAAAGAFSGCSGTGKISIKGVGTWNEESGAENLISTAAVNYFVRLHIARANYEGETTDYEAALQDLSSQANREVIAAKLVMLGNDAAVNEPLKEIAKEVLASGKTRWQIRVYTDANLAQPGKYFEVSLRRGIQYGELAAVRAYLKDHKDAAGKAVLVDRVFADDSAALKVLGMPK